MITLLCAIHLCAASRQSAAARSARIPDKLIQQMVKAQLNQRHAGDKADAAVKEADGWCRAHGMVLLPAKDGIAADCGPNPKAQ